MTYKGWYAIKPKQPTTTTNFKKQVNILLCRPHNLCSMSKESSDQYPKTAQSAWAVKYADCISAEGYDLSDECPDMTLNYLMVRFQPWSFG